MLPPDSAASDAAALELATLERLVHAIPVPARDLPGWESLTAHEYADSVQELAVLLGRIAAALAAARAAR